MPKFKHYTAKLVERQIKAIIRRNPNTINPMNLFEDCLYHQGQEPNIRRCLIGQWGFEQGFQTPEANAGRAAAVVKDMWSKQAIFDADAVDVLSRFQLRADGDVEAVRWGELIS